jgi:exo-beta-1,3-glucanase (GH17 family)
MRMPPSIGSIPRSMGVILSRRSDRREGFDDVSKTVATNAGPPVGLGSTAMLQRHTSRLVRLLVVSAALATLPAVLAAAPEAAAAPFAAASDQAAATAAVSGSSYIALAPERLLDTRNSVVVPAGGTVEVPVLGQAGVPIGGASAVFVNVTVVTPGGDGFLTAWPGGTTQPPTSTLNYASGQTIANGALVRVGTNGRINVAASASTHVLVDVQGYTPSDSPVVPLASAARLVDTRPGGNTIDGDQARAGRLGALSSMDVAVAGRAGIPLTGVAGVFVNIVAVDPAGGGFMTTWPTGIAMPNTSTANYARGQTIANNTFVGLGTGGKLSLFTFASTHILVDVVGYVPLGAAPTPATPARLFDSRLAGATIDGAGSAGGAIRSAAEMSVVVAGRGGVPLTGVGAVIVNVTAVSPTGDGFVSAWASGRPRPTASILNYGSRTAAIANTTIVPVGDGGRISLFAQASTQVLVDVVGWLPGSFPTPTKLSGLNVAPFIGSPRALAPTPNLLRELTDRVAPYTEWMRTYQCADGFDSFAVEARRLGLHMTMGAWLSTDSARNRREIDCVIAQAKAGNAEVIIVGNETLKNNWLTTAQLTTFIREVRAAVPAAVKVTTAEPDPIWFAHPSLFAEVDVVYANIYPFWASSPVAGAVAHLDGTYNLLRAAAGGKPITISETGWPTCGPARDGAVPSDANAATYLAGISAWSRSNGVRVFWLEAYDLAFKGKPGDPTEGCWGIWTADGLFKPGMREALN